MKRSKHSLSHYKLVSCDMGELVPVGCYEVLPGDTVQQASSMLLRVSPLLAPVMHPVAVRLHHWFVPHRLVWPEFEDFITGGVDGISAAAVFPTISTGAAGVAQGSLGDYLGIPTGVINHNVSALPFRSYAAIFNEFYRDQDLVSEATVSTLSGADALTSTVLKNVAWEKDYFTSSRPWPQRGPAVTLPLGSRAPVRGIGNAAQNFIAGSMPVYETELAAPVTYAFSLTMSAPTVAAAMPMMRGTAAAGFPDIYADLSAATSVNINDVREAFALQRYQEARAQYGSRYTEYLRYLGIRSSDARLQRPEYLGGGKQTIAFSEILQTGPTTSGNELGVGNLKGHGIAAMRSGRFRRFFEEHGLVITMMSVRPRTMYMDGLHRMWSRSTKEDYFQKELEQIGQQEVLQKEVFMQATSASDAVWSYQDRYSEYRHLPSWVTGEFRSTLLNFWHMARDFTSSAIPVLNSSFVQCDATKRINAVQTNDVLWIMVNNNIQARRLVGHKTIGKVL